MELKNVKCEMKLQLELFVIFVILYLVYAVIVTVSYCNIQILMT